MGSISKALAPFASCLLCVAGIATAQISPEEITVETMPDPGPNWFISKTRSGGYIFDATSGEMQGLLSLSVYTPAVTHYPERREFYAAESYLSRGVRGERTDIVAIYDYENLSPIAEIEIPNHMARLAVRGHLGLMNNGRHLAVLNMNPGHSVSIVDVQDRIFVYEISTPGCAVIMPVDDSDFMQICGDGTLQLIQLDISGFEQNRVRSDVFFNVIEDAIFDRTVRSDEGWHLISHGGKLFEAQAVNGEITISEGWHIQQEGEEDWRPGGGNEMIAAHQASGLVYVAMHQGPVDTHHVPGTEIWVLHADSQRRVHRLELDSAANSILVTQEDNPKLIVAGEDGTTNVFDAISFTHERSISAPGAQIFEDF